MEAPILDRRYTYEEYMSWPEDGRWELIDGAAYMLAAPNIAHQRISSELHRQLANFLFGKPCEVFHSAITVRLNANDDTAVEPDIVVVCDKSKLADGKACVGAPDLIVEILSPSTAGKDKLEKFNKYLSAGVREYWVVDPENKMVNIHLQEDGKYVTTALGEAAMAPVHVLPGCEIILRNVFTIK